MIKKLLLLFTALTFLLTSCEKSTKEGVVESEESALQRQSNKRSLRIGATPVPHAQILEACREDLAALGIELELIVTDDYQMPNRALAEGDLDANFFQHLPFLEAQIHDQHYALTSLGAIELEPFGAYSRKIQSLHQLKEGSIVVVPSDPSNEARALSLLHQHQLIRLDSLNNPHATLVNILHNPLKLQLLEVDGAMIARSLEEVDLAVINANYAMEAGLSPLHDALILEPKSSKYANILVVRTSDKERSDLLALKEALTSEKMRQFIQKTYGEAIQPAF